MVHGFNAFCLYDVVRYVSFFYSLGSILSKGPIAWYNTLSLRFIPYVSLNNGIFNTNSSHERMAQCRMRQTVAQKTTSGDISQPQWVMLPLHGFS